MRVGRWLLVRRSKTRPPRVAAGSTVPRCKRAAAMAAGPPQTPPTRRAGAPPASMDGSVVMALEYTPTPRKEREPAGERHAREARYCLLDVERRPWAGDRPWLANIRCSYGVDAWRLLLRRFERENVAVAAEVGGALFACFYETVAPSSDMDALWLRDLGHLCATAVGAFAFSARMRPDDALRDPSLLPPGTRRLLKAYALARAPAREVCAAAEANSPKKAPEEARLAVFDFERGAVKPAPVMWAALLSAPLLMHIVERRPELNGDERLLTDAVREDRGVLRAWLVRRKARAEHSSQ